jgi:hypothetical protein
MVLLIEFAAGIEPFALERALAARSGGADPCYSTERTGGTQR